MEEILQNVNWIDLAAVIVLITSGLFAYFRGFTHEMLSIFGWALAITLSLSLFPYLTPYAEQYIPDHLIAQLASGGAIFIATLVVSGLISSWIGGRVLDSGISALDRSLGFLYGLIRGAILVSMAFLIAHMLLGEGTRPAMIAESRVAPFGNEGARILVRTTNILLPKDFHIDEPDSDFQQMQDKARESYSSQTAPIQHLESLTNEIKRVTTPEDPANDASESGYSVDDTQDLNNLIKKELGQ